MVTRKLYHEDPYQNECSAEIVRIEPDNGHYRVVLDQTIFYPAAGGQPADRGFLGTIPVLNVLDEEEEIIHITPHSPVEGPIRCFLDWEHRFDHMQQHSGQHILSQSLLQIGQAETVSFHLSSDSVSIDLAIPDLDHDTLLQAEILANRIVFADIPVRILQLTPDEAASLSWRTALPFAVEVIRAVQIGSFDLCGCSGTHVTRTGEIGMIKILHTRPLRDMTRVEFACGGRARMDYHQKNEMVQSLSRSLTVGTSELLERTNQLILELSTIKKEHRDLLRTQDTYTAEALWEKGSFHRSSRLVTHVFADISQDRLKEMALYLTKKEQTIVLLGAVNPKPSLLFAASPGHPFSMKDLLQEALTPFQGKCGGSVHFVQGGGVNADEVSSVIAHAASLLDQ